MPEFTAALNEAIHEVADLAVNFGGYATESDESDARAVQRDLLERKLQATVRDFLAFRRETAATQQMVADMERDGLL